jgi:hypothetical protein
MTHPRSDQEAMAPGEEPTGRVADTSRLGAFSDGVVAAATLIAFVAPFVALLIAARPAIVYILPRRGANAEL